MAWTSYTDVVQYDGEGKKEQRGVFGEWQGQFKMSV